MKYNGVMDLISSTTRKSRSGTHSRRDKPPVSGLGTLLAGSKSNIEEETPGLKKVTT